MTARAKLADAESVAEALSWLTPPERLAVLGDRELLQTLARLARAEPPRTEALRSA